MNGDPYELIRGQLVGQNPAYRLPISRFMGGPFRLPIFIT